MAYTTPITRRAWTALAASCTAAALSGCDALSTSGENGISWPILTDKPQEQDLPEDYFKVLEIVGKYFTNNISLKRNSSGKGTMTIHFSSDEEISKFLKALEESSI